MNLQELENAHRSQVIRSNQVMGNDKISRAVRSLAKKKAFRLMAKIKKLRAKCI